MKIKEILELTMTINVPTIAKEHLSIGEKKLRDALKSIGCTNERGRKGWQYDGDDPELLEKSIYDFVTQRTQKVTATNKEVSQQSNNKDNQPSNLKNNTTIQQDKKVNKQVNNPENNKTKKVTYEIKEWLHDELKIRSIREKRNVSEIVNEILEKGIFE